MNLEALKAEFPRNKIHWRAQTLTKDGSKAMALAYLDARDVMDRLDAVCDPENWQTEHIDCGGGKLACRIGILIDGNWVWKSDGAGSTDIEAEKGAFSTALKRAAVAWGVGRYLYDMPSVWVPCESYKQGDKFRFKKFLKDPWSFVTPPAKGNQGTEGKRGAQDKGPPSDKEIKLYGYPENGVKKTKVYRRGPVAELVNWVTDFEIACGQDMSVYDINENMIEIVMKGIDRYKREDLRERMKEIEANILVERTHA